MYRVLVVDDEPITTDGICDLLQSVEEPELEVHGFISSREAVEFLEATKIDILFTDVAMPDPNGLELQRIAHEHWPDCRVIFLSAHGEFEYVQAAMREHAVDYILKTEDDESVFAALHRAVGALEDEARDRITTGQAVAFQEEALPVLRRTLLLGWIDGSFESREALARGVERYGIRLEIDRPVLLVIARVDSWVDADGPRADATIELEQSLARFLYRADVVAVDAEPDLLTWIVQARGDHADDSAGSERRFVTYVHENLDLFQRLAAEELGLRISLAAGRRPVPAEGVPAQFSRLEGLLSTLYRFETEAIAAEPEPSDALPPSESQADRDLRRLIGQLTNADLYIDGNDRSGCAELFESLRSAVASNTDTSPQVKNELFLTLSASLLSYLNRHRYFDAVAARHDLGRLLSLDRNASLDDALAFAALVCDSVYDLKERAGTDFGERVVREAQGYVQAHFGDDLSLTLIAERFGFNPSYFSRLFKRHAGENLSEYITRTRLDHARALLQDSSLRIGEVADRTGFRTISYFISVFKRHAGVTPQQYRAEGDIGSGTT
ncbi:MAG: response regulator transcription factor [Spirochaetota bacterium]